MKRIVPAALVVVLAAALVLVQNLPAQAATCKPTDVTVVVQFPSGTRIGCAGGDPSNGFEALRAAGFEPTRVQGRFAGALCSIDSFPQKECGSMPPANAYWSYWHGQPGGSWQFSSTGADGHDPAPGTSEGWRFGDGDAPSTRPAAAPAASTAPTPKPAPATSRPDRDGAGGTGGTGGTGGKGGTSGRPSRPAPQASAAAEPELSADPTNPSSPRTPTPTAAAAPEAPGTAGSSETSGAPGAAQSDSGGDLESAAGAAAGVAADDDPAGLSWIWGLVLLGVLGGLGGLGAYRRGKA